MTRDHDPYHIIAWAFAHPIASALFIFCGCLWGNASDGVRVPEWLLRYATLAAAFAVYFSIVRPWLFG
jgi:hypothetical protein